MIKVLIRIKERKVEEEKNRLNEYYFYPLCEPSQEENKEKKKNCVCGKKIHTIYIAAKSNLRIY